MQAGSCTHMMLKTQSGLRPPLQVQNRRVEPLFEGKLHTLLSDLQSVIPAPFTNWLPAIRTKGRLRLNIPGVGQCPPRD